MRSRDSPRPKWHDDIAQIGCAGSGRRRNRPRLCALFAARGSQRDPAAFEKSAWLPQALKDAGLPIETLDSAECRAREPALNDSVTGGYFHPLDAHLRPNRYVAELARAVREKGGEICESAAIRGL